MDLVEKRKSWGGKKGNGETDLSRTGEYHTKFTPHIHNIYIYRSASISLNGDAGTDRSKAKDSKRREDKAQPSQQIITL